MNKAVPWNINGVGFDAREAAREAARRQGKSLGEWLHGVIADHAAELGVEEHDIGGQDRIDAVTLRLERLSERASDGDARGRTSRRDRGMENRLDGRDRGGRDSGFEGDDAIPRFRRLDRERPERTQNERRTVSSAEDQDQSEFLLENAIDAMERRTLKAHRKTEKALASFAKIIETTEIERGDERELTSALLRKLSDLEQRISSRTTDDNYRPIKGALARVEARLDTLGRRGPLDAGFTAPAAMAAGPSVASSHAEEPIQRLESKLNTILDAIVARPGVERPAPSMYASAIHQPIANQPVMETSAYAISAVQADRTTSNDSVAAPIVAPPFANRRLGEAIADIAQHQRRLEKTASDRRDTEPTGLARRAVGDTGAYQTSGAVHHLPANGLQSDIAGLALKIEEMRREMLARANAPKPSEATTQIDDLRLEVAGIAKLMRDMAPPASIHGQITQMTAALEDMRRDGARREEERHREGAKLTEVASRTDLESLKAEIGSIAKTLTEMAPRENVKALENTIRTLIGRMEKARDDHTHEAALRPVDDLVGELRRWLADIDPRATITGLEREVRTIGEKLDDLNGVDVSALGRIQNQTEEIRELLSAAANPPAVERIERQVASLSEKIDRQPRPGANDDRAFQTAANDIRAILENAPGLAVFDKIEQRLESLTAKVDQAVDEASGARKVAELSRRHFDVVQNQIAARLANPAPPAEVDMRSLESLVRDLSARIEAVRAPDAGGAAIEALQDQIVQLANRFERTDSGLAALSTIEQSMQGLFAHLEETRMSVETAAAKAAREATRAALVDHTSPDPAAIREIATLKAIQTEADQRTHQTLNAVHATLEKVVGRLSLMETDIAEARTPRRAAAETAPTSETSRPEARDLDTVRLERQRPDVHRFETPPEPSRAESSRSGSSRSEFSLRPETRRVETGKFEGPKAGSRPARPAPLPDLMLDDPGAFDPTMFTFKDHVRTPSTGPTDLDESAGRADFIAAARRAALAARSDPSVLAMKRLDDPSRNDSRAGLIAKTRDYVASHKKPVLLGIAALFVVMGTLAVMGSLTQRILGSASGEVIATSDSEKTAAAAPEAPVQVVAAASSVNEPTAGRATGADLTPSALPSAPPPAGAALPGSDPVTTGSITRLPSFAAQGMAAPASIAPSGSLRQLADTGNAAAQYELASRYAEGRQLPKDMGQAAIWYQKAAQQGLAPAQYKLASLYEKGLGVPRDKAKAGSWYLKAADAGNPRAMHNLAVLLADGDGKPDYTNAVIWFRKAAEYGVHDSQYNLGILLARGLGTTQSLVQSYQWFSVAAADNDPDAATKRDEVAGKLTPNDLSVAKALAAAFHPKTATRAATEIPTPAAGWDGASSPSLVKSARSKLSSL